MKRLLMVAITLLALTSCSKKQKWQCTATVISSGTNFGSHVWTSTTTFTGTKEEMLAYEKQQTIPPTRTMDCR